MEVRIDVEEYGSLIIRPQSASRRKDNIFVALVDPDSADEHELVVLTINECAELIEALTLVRDKAQNKYFASLSIEELGGYRTD